MRTAAEIDYILASNGATAIQKDIANGQITALRFTVQTSLGLIPIQLPVNVEAVQEILKAMRQRKVRGNVDYSKEQAARVAWRCLKSCVEDVARYWEVVDGKFNIFSEDCGRNEKDIEATLEGRYGIYYKDGYVFFVRWGDK